MTFTDPFADPIAPRITVSQPVLDMPQSPLRKAAAEVQETVDQFLLARSITSSEVVPPILQPPVEEPDSPVGYIPPPVIDSSVGDPGAFTDVSDELEPDITQDSQAIAPHVEPITFNVPEPAEPEALITELLDEHTYFVGPMAESIKDFQPVDHADNKAEFSEAVHGNVDNISPEPLYEQNGEAAFLPEPKLGQREEPEAYPHADAVPVTERERQEEPQQKTEPIPISVLVPVPNYSMSLGSKRDVWGSEHDHGAYPSSAPVINTSPKDVKRVERSPAPSIGFVDSVLFRGLDPKINLRLECHL